MNSEDDTYSLPQADRDLVAYYLAGSLQAAFTDIVAESGATQKNAEKSLSDEIQKKYGESIEAPLASESDRLKITQIYKEFINLTGSAQEERAKKILENFLKTRPEKNPDAKASNLEKVMYLYGLAIRANGQEVRTALTQAFEQAKSETKAQ